MGDAAPPSEQQIAQWKALGVLYHYGRFLRKEDGALVWRWWKDDESKKQSHG